MDPNREQPSPLVCQQGAMEEMEPEEQLRRCARNGDLPGIERLLLSKIREETHININCRGVKSTCE